MDLKLGVNLGFATNKYLTTMRKSPSDLGRHAVGKLLERLREKEKTPGSHKLAAQLVVRDSVAILPNLPPS
ncbi:hypothetical protein [Paenibacillus sp. GCM10027626]|uniref:hypothetical protein n=1 Tax=Paenibacillus sp. GCM10027626 TaxID=3273411 RepID=UPI00363CF2F0